MENVTFFTQTKLNMLDHRTNQTNKNVLRCLIKCLSSFKFYQTRLVPKYVPLGQFLEITILISHFLA